MQDLAVYRNTICPECGHDLKVCLMCRFYDKDASDQCRESSAESVAEKDKANFCSWFSLNTDAGKREDKQSSPLNAKQAFSNLFGDS